ncbi:ATP-binding protein [Luteitalea sp.]|jgi:signal transduction histidine kinase/ActR/RegA family two-component response regulator|uniref:ATP-binding protein n=1 Tax=Luteitalea sp. TaxID=2004800 RepID=UPI0037CA0AC4
MSSAAVHLRGSVTGTGAGGDAGGGAPASVHEAVAGVQQALLWGLEIDECRHLALHAALDLTDGVWAALVAGDLEQPPKVVLEHDRGPSAPTEWTAAGVAQAAPAWAEACLARQASAVPVRLPAIGRPRRVRRDVLLVLPIPGSASGPASTLLVVRHEAVDAAECAAALDPLLRLTGQLDALSREVHARRSAERALERERHRLGLALAASDVGVFEFHARSGLLDWDARVWEMHGLDPRASWTLGDWAGIVHPDDAHAAIDDLMGAVEHRTPLQTQYRILTAAGEVRHIRCNARVLDQDGAPVVVGVNIDISGDVRVQQDLAAERAQAEAATRAKSQFLATMSHEIRTPMNGVLGMLELLLRSGLTPEQLERAATAHASAESLLRILNDILDLSKLEQHQVAIESIPYEPALVLAEVMALLRPRAAEKGLRFSQELVREVPRWIAGDPMRLRQVVLNLTGNAIKFTACGSVTVRVRLDRGDAARPCLRVEIADTGEGIAPEAQARLFQQFVQADASTSRRFGGTGLGLAISKQLVELMGGRIGVTSQVGRGSTFWFEVPAVTTVPDGAPASTARGPAPGAADAEVPALRILAVDDNAVNRRIAQAFLSPQGHRVTVADGGVEALARLQDEPFDLVLLDVQMPVMDGPACLARLRALEAPVRDVPVIAVTANAMAGDREQYLAAGFDDYVSKPMTMTGLAEAVARAWAGRRQPS